MSASLDAPGPGRASAVRPGRRSEPRTTRRARDLLLVVGLPLLLTALVVPASRNDDTVRPTAAYLVLVVAATSVSGLRAGIVTWILSGFLLWFVVFRPEDGLLLRDSADTISMVVFMVTTGIALVVVNRLREDRLRARQEVRLRRVAEAEVRAAADRAQLLQQLAERMSAESDVAGVARVIVEHCRHGLGATAAGACTYDEDAEELVLAEVDGYPDATVEAGSRIPLGLDVPVALAARERETVFLEDADAWQRRFADSAIPPAEGFEARCAIPLFRTSGELLGAVVMSWAQPRAFGDEVRTFIQTFGTMCASSLERAMLAGERERVRFASALEAMIDPVGIYTAVRDESGKVVDFRVAYVNEARGDGDGYSPGFAPQVGRTFSELFVSATARGRLRTYIEVVETRRPARLSGVQIVPEEGAEPRSYDIHVSPFGDGVIVATRDVTERERAVRELALSDARLRAAQRVSHVGSWETDVATGATIWSEELYRMFGAEPGEDTENIMLRTIGADVERLRSLVESLQTTGVPLDTEYDVRLPGDRGRRFRVRAELHEGEHGALVRGVVQDITDERELQAAVTSLRSDLRDERAAVEVLQRALLPQQLPQPDGIRVHATYRPSGESALVGGDWYDAFLLPSGRLAFTVGDVAGHGIGAASAMSELRHALRAYARTSHAPSEALRSLDAMFTASGEEPYATCFYAVCDLDTHTLTWGNAGHLPMVLVRDGVAEPVGSVPGAPLGAGVGVFRDHELELRPGDRLLVYTDGLVERRGDPLDVGITALCDAASRMPLLPARDMCERLTDIMLKDFAHDDDVCVLAVELLDADRAPSNGADA